MDASSFLSSTVTNRVATQLSANCERRGDPREPSQWNFEKLTDNGEAGHRSRRGAHVAIWRPVRAENGGEVSEYKPRSQSGVRKVLMFL